MADYDRLDEKLSDLMEKVESNHLSTIQALHNLELKVSKHDSMFGILKFLIPSGSALGAIAWVQNLFKN